MRRKIIDLRNIKADSLEYIVYFQNEMREELNEKEQKEVLIKLTNVGLLITKQEQIDCLLEIMKNYAEIIA
ncbi:MAG: hypothetical protein ACRCTJ_01645 [Brevinema sp.]